MLDLRRACATAFAAADLYAPLFSSSSLPVQPLCLCLCLWLCRCSFERLRAAWRVQARWAAMGCALACVVCGAMHGP
eukprot:821488-Rhodomonas_salina.4